MGIVFLCLPSGDLFLFNYQMDIIVFLPLRYLFIKNIDLVSTDRLVLKTLNLVQIKGTGWSAPKKSEKVFFESKLSIFAVSC